MVNNTQLPMASILDDHSDADSSSSDLDSDEFESEYPDSDSATDYTDSSDDSDSDDPEDWIGENYMAELRARMAKRKVAAAARRLDTARIEEKARNMFPNGVDAWSKDMEVYEEANRREALLKIGKLKLERQADPARDVDQKFFLYWSFGIPGLVGTSRATVWSESEGIIREDW